MICRRDVHDCRAMETADRMEIFAMGVFLQHCTCQVKSLILVRAAAVFLAVVVMMLAARVMLAVVLRMDVHALCAFDEGYDECLAAAAAGMYAETDDTYEVPSQQHNSKNLYNQSFHTNPQRYKIVPKLQYV